VQNPQAHLAAALNQGIAASNAIHDDRLNDYELA
jgi:hypothetical protein